MSLKDVFGVINQMRADGVIERYALGGAVAATFYLEPVATVDVDIFVTFRAVPGSRPLSAQPIFEYLTARGYNLEREYVVIAKWPVQFLPPTSSLVEDALLRAREVDVEGEPVHILSAEHLAAIALETGRPKDYSRLIQFVESGVLDAQRLEEILQRHSLQGKWTLFKGRFMGDAP